MRARTRLLIHGAFVSGEHDNSDHAEPSRRNSLSSLFTRFATDYLKLSVPLANLERHGLIVQLGYPDKDPHHFENTDVAITPFGDAFVRACRSPSQSGTGPHRPAEHPTSV
jgi:hypothetical protein